MLEVPKKAAKAMFNTLVRRPIEVSTPLGFRYILLPKDPRTLKMAMGLYETDDVQAYRALKLQSGRIIDVGANIGFFTLLFATAFPNCSVSAVEANPYCIERLRANIAANPSLATRITVFPYAAGDSETLVSFTSRPGASEHPWGRVGVEAQTGMQSITVMQKPLDDIFSDPVSLIKIDVEGYELNVLRGALGIIERSRPIIVYEVCLSYLELRPGDLEGQLAIAKRYGYKPMIAAGKRLVPYTQPVERIFNMWLMPAAL